MCRYTTMKKNDAPTACMYCSSQPYGTSRRRYSTELNALDSPALKCMVMKMPVTICMTNTSSASEPKKYQMLKFFGA